MFLSYSNPLVRSLSENKWFSVHCSDRFDMRRCRLCSGSIVNCESMPAPSFRRDFVNIFWKDGHSASEYVFSNSWPLSSSPFLTLSILSPNFEVLYTWVAVHIFPTMIVSLNDRSLAIQILITSSPVTVYAAYGFHEQEHFAKLENPYASD